MITGVTLCVLGTNRNSVLQQLHPTKRKVMDTTGVWQAVTTLGHNLCYGVTGGPTG